MIGCASAPRVLSLGSSTLRGSEAAASFGTMFTGDGREPARLSVNSSVGRLLGSLIAKGELGW